MERLRQRRVKRARVAEARSLVCLGPGGSGRDPGNGWALAGAEGEGQGWEKPWAGGRGVPREGGGGWGTGCQGPADGSLPHTEGGELGAGPEPSTSPFQPVPPRSAHCPHRHRLGPQRLPTLRHPKLPPAPPLAPRRHAPSLFSGSGTAPSPSQSGPLAFPLTSPGVSSPRPRQPGSYSTVARFPPEAQSRDSWVSASQSRELGALRLREPESGSLAEWGAVVRISWFSKQKMLGDSTL